MRHSFAAELAKLAPTGRVITSREELLAYSYDGYSDGTPPDVVVLPGDREELVSVARTCLAEDVPLTFRGAGTSLSGASVPARGGVVLATGRVNRVLEIDEENLTATVESGAVLGGLQARVESRGLFYPPDPSSASVCTIGGNVAHDSCGMRALKYGTTRAFVLGLETLLASGEIVKTGGKPIKQGTGYDLTRLFVGSEGTLGLFLTVTLRLIPKPPATSSLLATFESEAKATEAVVGILHSGVTPVTAEFMDRTCIKVTEDFCHVGLPADAGALLILEVDGSAAAVAEELEKVRMACVNAGANSLLVGSTSEERERVWRGRKSVVAALTRGRYRAVWEDFTIPRSRITDAVEGLGRIGRHHDLVIVNFGHPGDGTFHPTILVEQDRVLKDGEIEGVIAEIFRLALELGGSLTGEHGIGLAKKRYLRLEVGDRALEQMKMVKRTFDPKNLLNPYKMWL